MFYCKYCSFTTLKSQDHVDHHKFHSSLDRQIRCGFERCTNAYPDVKQFRVHLIRTHNFRANVKGHPEQTTINENATYKCTLDSCCEKFYCYDELLKHLKNHINDGHSVLCPYHPCKKKYFLVSSLTGHISKKHKSELVIVSDQETVFDCAENLCFEEDGELLGPGGPPAFDEDSAVPVDVHELYLKNLAQFYLKLETQFMVPASTVQYISSEMSNIDQLGTDIILKQISDTLVKLGLDNEQLNKVTSQLANPFSQANAKLGTDYLRKKFFRNLPGYVKPKEINMGVGDDGKKRVFHFVPIDASLKAMLNDKAISAALLQDIQNRATQVYEDFYNGSVFKNNTFFKENPDALPLILYQDEFEVVCPIGAAKNKYKILAVYYSLGNLPPHMRSNPKNIQLVALCRKKYFNAEKVFGTIVKNLLKLEKDGVEVSPNQFKKVAIAFIAGDNLGSHSLGGFVENFSTSHYFCRYCLIHRKDLNNFPSQTIPEVSTEEDSESMEAEDTVGDSSDGEEVSTDSESEADGVSSGDSESESEDSSDEESLDEPLVYLQKSHPKRTVESYKNSLLKLESTSNKSYEGIKSDSLFNQLAAFHVCLPGLAPCLGHDLTEGVIAFDLALFTQIFIKKKEWFSYANLKTRIENFKYSSIDLRDRPVALCEDAKRVVGGAWQVWTLLRLFPLIIGDKIKDVENPAWLAILKMIEIMEMVTAPSIHHSFIAHLQLTIGEYLTLRVKALPHVKLRPKHHYLTHFPKLLKELGNLMKCWTLRFESKHSYFKRIMRVLKNFKNVTYSLAEKHQLYQALLREIEDYETFLPAEKKLLNINLYNFNLQVAIYEKNLIGDIYECNTFCYKGCTYKKGDVVVLRQEAYNVNVVMGQIVLLLVDDHGPHLVVEVKQTEFNSSMRFFELQDGDNKYECISPDKLLSTEPLHVYTHRSRYCVKLKHGLVAQEMKTS